MNQEKAKEIVIKGESFKLEKDKSYQLEEIISLSTAKWKEFHEAKGYLKAVEKFRGGMEAIGHILSFEGCHCDEDKESKDMSSCGYCHIQKILDQWESLK